MTSPTFQEFVEGPWRLACHSQCKPSTQRRMDGALRTQLLPSFGPSPIDCVEANDVHVWFDSYSTTAPGGANRALDVLRQVFNHAVACGHRSDNPTRRIKPNRRPRLTRFLSTDEVERLHHALDAHKGRGSGRQQSEIIRLLLLTGCRKSEIVHLRWSEVDGDTLHLSDSKTGPRAVLLNRKAQEIIGRQQRSGTFVFPALTDSSQPRSTELSLWKKVRRDAGIPDVRLHDLRHTFASHAVMRGVPLPVLARLMGHSGTRMTLRYAHVADREMEAAAERVGAALAEVLFVRGPPSVTGVA